MTDRRILYAVATVALLFLLGLQLAPVVTIALATILGAVVVLLAVALLVQMDV